MFQGEHLAIVDVEPAAVMVGAGHAPDTDAQSLRIDVAEGPVDANLLTGQIQPGSAMFNRLGMIPIRMVGIIAVGSPVDAKGPVRVMELEVDEIVVGIAGQFVLEKESLVAGDVYPIAVIVRVRYAPDPDPQQSHPIVMQALDNFDLAVIQAVPDVAALHQVAILPVPVAAKG